MTRRVELCRVRNIGIVAHVDAGKTTLTERVLFLTGAVHRMGEVHHGNTTTDSDQLEQQKGITISAAAVTCAWQKHELHLIDTPGHIDFSADVELSLRVLDGAIVVLDGVAGVEAQTEAVWRQADRYELPRLCFVNKLDRAGANFEACVASLEERLDAPVAVVCLPIGQEQDFVGIVDVIEQRALTWSAGRLEVGEVPPELLDAMQRTRARLVEQCADYCDRVLDGYVTGDVVAADTLRAALRKATVTGQLVPVLCGSAYKTRGVEHLLDAVCHFLPAPSDRPAVVGETGGQRAPKDDEALSLLVFKVIIDDFGWLALGRVFSGTAQRGDRVLCASTGRAFRIRRMVRVFADRREDIASAGTGDIVGLVGSDLSTGDTVCALEHPLCLKRPTLPEPVVRVAVEPKSRSDQERLATALAKLAFADPSLKLESDAETGQTVLCGLGELHLEIALEKLRSVHGVAASVGRPSVAYREALTKEVRHEYKLCKQTGGPGQFAQLTLIVGPGRSGLTFESEVRGGAIPQEYFPGIRKGAEDAMATGAFAGFPVTGLRVRLLDGVTHPKDSSDQAFRIASRRCVLEAMARAEPQLLEPIMRVEVILPEQRLGDTLGDLGARRGQVLELAERGNARVVIALVPLSELFGYAGTLRSLTSGRGTFSMELEAYQAAPSAVAERVQKQTTAA